LLRIDRAGVRDHGVVTGFLLEYSRANQWEPEDDRDRWERIVAELLNSERWLFLIAHDDDEPVGMAAVSFCLSLTSSREEARLAVILVDEGHRRLGIGTLLMESVVAAVGRRGCRELEARVDRREEAAIAFYNRFDNPRERLVLTWPCGRND